MERLLGTMKEVARVNSVKIVSKFGTGYSDTRYDVSSNISPDGGLVFLPKNCIWEIKSRDDITGKIQ